jgi:large subunit ribosomal protein L32e
MTDTNKLLERRRQIKKRKPFFRKKDHYKTKGLEKRWRRPRGVDNKQRLRRRAHALRPGTGFKSPALVKGLHRSGLKPVLISSINQLNNITKEQGIMLSSKLGNRKRALILLEIKKRGFALLNLDAEKTIVKIQASVKERQEAKKKELLATKEDKEKDKKKGIEEAVKKEKAPEKEKEKAIEQEEGKDKEALTDEEKKKLEKEEKDKLLTKKV